MDKIFTILEKEKPMTNADYKTDNPLHIVMAASEAVPFAKCGGLGDVAGILPSALAKMGHHVTLMMPLYATIDLAGYELHSLIEPMGVPMGNGTKWCRLLGTTIEPGFDVCFVEQNDFFNRSGIYDENGQGYRDNGSRYLFFSRAVVQACLDLNMSPDVIHCHDWMTSSIPAYLKYFMTDNPLLGDTGSLLTIHNIGGGYQGICGKGAFDYSGLPWEAYSGSVFEDNGSVNLLKGGIAMADIINAVSPTFAHEITQPATGGGLDHFLRMRGHDLHGVLNGVDYESWNPEIDKFIAANYSADNMAGKHVCKSDLQAEFGLDQDPHAPLMGVVSRMNGQKGLDYILEALDPVIEMGAQFVILGTGDKALESAFMKLPGHYPGRVGSYIGFDNGKAHRIEAGSDIFLMPSRWEPCGLNQLYSLRYGTLPLVRATGGLDDTVINSNPAQGEGTGFKYKESSSAALSDTMIWAARTYWELPEHFQSMQRRAMEQRFTWEHSARSYEKLYNWAKAKRAHWR